MSYAQPSPPMIHTLFLTSKSARASNCFASGVSTCCSRCFSRPTRSRCEAMSASSFWGEGQQSSGEVWPDGRRHARHQFASELRLLIDRDAEAQTKLGIVFKQRVRPRWAAAFGVLGPRRGRKISAVDGRAAGGIGNHGAVAEQLRHQLEVRSLAATGASAGEFKQTAPESAADGWR